MTTGPITDSQGGNAPAPRRPVILCVDDEPSILSSLHRLFHLHGFELLAAHSAQEGLELLAQRTVDLVISDMRMPYMDGVEFLEHVRQRYPDILRLLLTGYADIASITGAINRGEIYRYIVKPWDDTDIILTVQGALERSTLVKEKKRLEALVIAQNEELKAINASLEIKVQERTAEIRQAHYKLEQDEARFRNLIEQTLTGIFVTQDNKIVYANPRLCEILGWALQDLLGKETTEFMGESEEVQKHILEKHLHVNAEAVGALVSVTLHNKDDQPIDLGLQANMGIWNGESALVVMVQDISERKRAEEKIAAYVKQLEGTMRGTLQAVANMVDLRDPYTSGHERRVGIIAADIAQEMGWTPERCQSLQLIGLVHDIGKIAVPAEILSKPTRLTALEYEMVKTHAEKGFEILKDVEFPLPIAEIIREHHERMDGSGYPQGLKGDAILPEARILAVADVLESMASHRPYRPAMGLPAAIEEIESHRGAWYDPPVVDAALRLIREKNYQLPT